MKVYSFIRFSFICLAISLGVFSAMAEIESSTIIIDSKTEPNMPLMATDSYGNVGVVWGASQPGVPYYYNDLYYSRFDALKAAWESPHPILTSEEQIDYMQTDIAAADNGVWMISLRAKDYSPPSPSLIGIVVSRDSGITWGNVVDLSTKFPLLDGDRGTYSDLRVGYAGEDSWLVVYTTTNSVRYVRSNDNGQSWGEAVYVHRNSENEAAFIASPPDGTSVAINYRNFDLPRDPRQTRNGQRVSIFSNDNGRTFGYPIPSMAVASDNNGNSVLADWKSIEIPSDSPPYLFRSEFSIKVSHDGGKSFNELGDPPDIKTQIPDIQRLVLDNISITDDGKIMIVGTGFFPGGAFINLPRSGYFSVTNDLGKTWSNWDRLPGDRYPVAGNLFSLNNVFWSVFAGHLNGSARELVYARSYDPSTVTAATDWQLYE